MSKFLPSQMDYVFFVYGLSFVFIAAMCLVLRARDRSLPWGLLAAFGAIHGVNEWLDMLALGAGDSPTFRAIRVCVMALSFCCLVEFGRLGTRSVTGRGPGRWITALLFVIGCAGWSFDWVGLNVFFRYALGFVGGIWSVAAFVRAARCEGKRDERRLLLALGWVFAAYAVASGLVVPKAPFLPASLLNQDIFLHVFGFPVQLLRASLAMASAICVWQLLHVRETFAKKAYALLFAGSVLALLASGWYIVNRTGAEAGNKFKDNLLTTCRVLASSIDPKVADELGSVTDTNDARNQFLRTRFMAILQTAPEYRWIYLMSKKDDKIIFTADSEPVTSKDYTKIGTVYSDAPQLLRALFRGENRRAVEEYEDKWGAWVSAFVPIQSRTTRKTVAVLGVDQANDLFQKEIAEERLGPIAITLLVLVLMIVFLAAYERQRVYIERISASERTLRESETRFDQLAEHSRTIAWEVDAQGLFTYVSHASEAVWGYKRDELVGWMHFYDMHPEAGREAFRKAAFAVFALKESFENLENATQAKDGRIVWVSTNGIPLLNSDGTLHGYRGSDTDITIRKKAEEEAARSKAETDRLNTNLEEALVNATELAVQAEMARSETEEKAVELSHQASHDALTALPNRKYFGQHLSDLIAGNTGKRLRSMVVLFLDLDKFKLINDTLGHKIGDLLLIEVAERLQSCLRSGDFLARMGGDEFTVILPRCNRRPIAQLVASRMIDSISRPFEIQGNRFVIGASIGLASYPSDGKDAVTLLKHADAAMYRSKQSGRGNYCWFTGDVDVDNQQRVDMEMDIRAALDEGQFNVCYQPIVGLEDDSTLAAEALLRWQHPEKGMISPSLFIPIAEEIGLIGQIGDYVLRTACAQTAAWRDEGIHLSHIAVNVSTRQVRDASWLDSVISALSDTGLDARCLDLELTETDFAEDYESMRNTLQKVQELGISLAIDDFGIGQSSLSRLKDFPVIHLKIDGSFVRDIEYNKSDNALVRSIVEMAHAQGIKVTAEWVETQSQMEILLSIGCDFAQGYYFSPALSSEAFGDFARDWVFGQRKANAA